MWICIKYVEADSRSGGVPIRSFPIALALTLAGALALLAPTPASATDPSECAAAWNVARLGAAALQNDSYSGGDAGDSAAYAVPLRGFGYSWGTLDPPARADFADSQDWYSFVLARASRVMAEVNATIGYGQVPQAAGSSFPEALRFTIDAFAPGDVSPTFVGQPNARGGANVTFTDARVGTWYLRVAYAHPSGAPVACQGVYPNPTIPVAKAGEIANYGVYFGCDPICATFR